MLDGTILMSLKSNIPNNIMSSSPKVMAPNEFQGSVIGGINRRTGIIQNTDMSEDGSGCVIHADVPLAQVGCTESFEVCTWRISVEK